MDEKRISAEEFDAAVEKVIADMLKDEHIEGMSRLVIPLTGTLFASKMRTVLFGEDKENG